MVGRVRLVSRLAPCSSAVGSLSDGMYPLRRTVPAREGNRALRCLTGHAQPASLDPLAQVRDRTSRDGNARTHRC
jgi:hypothetical protein